MRSTYYNNFASHLLNAYNPNMLYPDLGNRWSNEDWYRCIDMVASFGFSAFEFWLEPRLFCRDGLSERYGVACIDQVHRIIDHVHARDMEVIMLCSLATVGSEWRTLCPNIPDEWDELTYLWRAWLERLSGIDVVALFPGDPGACSLNGCTAKTYIDRSLEIALIADAHDIELELNTWGPPIFGWGILGGPPGWNGEFVQSYQDSAWEFDIDRSNSSMEHLVSVLPRFPERTSVAINLGFNPDGNPGGADDAVGWVEEIARTRRVYSWDFSLTEGENAITPHWRFDRLFERRREERRVGSYEGGICFTMTPMLNQLSFYEAARSFQNPDDDPMSVAGEFFMHVLGVESGTAEEIVRLYRRFEIIDDWGYYSGDPPDAGTIEADMVRLLEILRDDSLRRTAADRDIAFLPDVTTYVDTLEFYAELYRDLSTESPDYEAVAERFWSRVYVIYDDLPEHVDPRPRMATDRLIERFRALSRSVR